MEERESQAFILLVLSLLCSTSAEATSFCYSLGSARRTLPVAKPLPGPTLLPAPVSSGPGEKSSPLLSLPNSQSPCSHGVDSRLLSRQKINKKEDNFRE